MSYIAVAYQTETARIYAGRINKKGEFKEQDITVEAIEAVSSLLLHNTVKFNHIHRGKKYTLKIEEVN